MDDKVTRINAVRRTNDSILAEELPESLLEFFICPFIALLLKVSKDGSF